MPQVPPGSWILQGSDKTKEDCDEVDGGVAEIDSTKTGEKEWITAGCE